MPLTISEAIELFVSNKDTTTIGGDPYKIVVLDRGFVVYGRVEKQGDYIVISECRCIRKWGTKNGLGELATFGKRDGTVLDSQPNTRVHQLQVVQMIDAGDVAWKQ